MTYDLGNPGQAQRVRGYGV